MEGATDMHRMEVIGNSHLCKQLTTLPNTNVLLVPFPLPDF